ncbi:MAG: hypothetical protein ACE5JS_07570 [Nitrospinota bacterium]
MHSPSHRAYGVALKILLALTLAGCGSSVPESERVVRSFVEAYYVQADLAAAVRLAEGLARVKIDRQAKLRTAPPGGGAVPTSPGLSGARSVEYEILETRERAEGGKVFRIGLTISSKPVTLNVQTLITVGQKGKGEPRRWVVLNFTDFSGPTTGASRK